MSYRMKIKIERSLPVAYYLDRSLREPGPMLPL